MSDITNCLEWQKQSILHSAFGANSAPHDIFRAASAFYPWTSVARRIDVKNTFDSFLNIHVSLGWFALLACEDLGLGCLRSLCV